MNKPRRRSSGPRTFDRDQAVEIAMRLFRRHGYEGVSVADLTAAIGIAPPSMYAAFGNKAGLYREALDRYTALPGAIDRHEWSNHAGAGCGGTARSGDQGGGRG
jgi:AcrR family transcriptional regulator